jgi:hypothetical protein
MTAKEKARLRNLLILYKNTYGESGGASINQLIADLEAYE